MAQWGKRCGFIPYKKFLYGVKIEIKAGGSMAGYDDHQSDYSGYDDGYNAGYDDGYADASEPQYYDPSAHERKRCVQKRNARIAAQNRKFMRGCVLAVLVAFFACYGFSLLMEWLG